ncbi:MAG: OmpH family outer membrane protein [Gemmatimonadetes bacterium]|nr:OmpH family outer membrane protein [Gemmatimonadota bacterium]MBI2402564.1 OmpH family outer membrane protein [Gemmatimonadota bacterium]MBI2615529.1 OmpH family outer membrane protein [Gemmatimonadota bacterium]
MARWALPALAVLVVAGLAAAPQQQTSVRLAFVNSQAILQQTPGYAAAESTYSKELEGFQSEMLRLRQRLDSTVAAYQQSSVGLSASQRQTKEAEIRRLQQQVDQRSNELRQRAQERERELIQPLEDRVKAVIEGIRAERNIGIMFDVAAPGSGIIAADQSLDMTALVVQRLKAGQQQQ